MSGDFQFTKDPNEVGALWIKTSGRGDYMTGEINGQRIVCFRIAKEPGSRTPDWRVLKARPRAEEPMAPSTPGGDFEAGGGGLGDIPF